MKSVVAHLNAVIEGRMPTQLEPEAARLALHAIESHALTIGALRLVVGQRKSMKASPASVTEALDHAERLLDLHDAYVKKHTAPNPAPVTAAKEPESIQDVSDLV